MKIRLTLLITLISVTMIASAQQLQQPPLPPEPPQQNLPPEPMPIAKSDLTYKIIDAANYTFGYDVFTNGRLMVHQTSIPAMPGNEGFKTKEDAAKVAELVMQKIERGEMPPNVSVDELKALKVIPSD